MFVKSYCANCLFSHSVHNWFLLDHKQRWWHYILQELSPIGVGPNQCTIPSIERKHTLICIIIMMTAKAEPQSAMNTVGFQVRHH